MTLIPLLALISSTDGAQCSIAHFTASCHGDFFFYRSICFFCADEEGGAATCEEGLHGGTLSQFDRRLSGVGGQSGVCAVVQEQPDYWQVVARHCVVERPDQRKKTMSADLDAHKDVICAGLFFGGVLCC